MNTKKVLLASLATVVMGTSLSINVGLYSSKKEVEEKLEQQLDTYKLLSKKEHVLTQDNLLLVKATDGLEDTITKLEKDNKKLKSYNVSMTTKNIKTLNDLKIKLDNEEKSKKELESLKLTNTKASISTAKTATKDVATTSKGNFRATGYGADCVGCSGRTASGAIPVQGVTVAADPNVLPLGTTVSITFPNAPQYNGVYTVQDTGGAIKGNKLDIFLGTEANTHSFGVQNAIVTIIK